MSQITIECPDDLLVSLGTTQELFEREARFALAAKLFEQGRLSSGKAARLAGMDRVTFLRSLHRVGVAMIDLDESEIEHERRDMAAASNEIVVNTGPLIALDACDQVELLHGLHPRVIVPQAVVTELTSGTHAAGAQVFNIPQWIEVLPLRQAPSPLLQAHLDDGEASVIALAIELGLRLVVIDERRGRQIARLMGLDVTGTVGVLLRAKREGMLPAIRPCLEAMRSHGVWLSDRLIAFAVAEAGER